MRQARLRLAATVASLLAVLTSAPASAQPLRPPATPLATVDPYFSVWSFADRLTDENTRHWTGKPQPISLQARIDGKTVRLAGRDPARVPALGQTSVAVRPTTTRYEFEGEGVGIAVEFVTAVLPHDLEWFARPVTFVRWTARSLDGHPHQVRLLLTAAAHLAVNTTDQRVLATRVKMGDAQVLRIGSQEQPVLARSGDNLRIDWGFLYVAARGSEVLSAVAPQGEAWAAFARDGSLPDSDDVDFPRPASARTPALAFVLDAGQVAAEPVARQLMLAYDDLFSIQYLNRRLRPYWRRNGCRRRLTCSARALKRRPGGHRTVPPVRRRADGRPRAGRRGEIRGVGALAYRQALAAHKLVADVDGTPLHVPQGELHQRLHRHGGRHLPGGAALPAAQRRRCSKATLKPVLRLRALAALEVPVRAARPGHLSAGQRPGLRRRRAHRGQPDAGRGERQHAAS